MSNKVKGVGRNEERKVSDKGRRGGEQMKRGGELGHVAQKSEERLIGISEWEEVIQGV